MRVFVEVRLLINADVRRVVFEARRVSENAFSCKVVLLVSVVDGGVMFVSLCVCDPVLLVTACILGFLFVGFRGVIAANFAFERRNYWRC